MTNLTTKYMGLTLKSPIIAGSSGLTNSLNNLKQIEQAGAGAVVLKSIFEEQIRHETDSLINKPDSELMKPMHSGMEELLKTRSGDYVQALEYIRNFAKEHTLKEYLTFVEDAKKAVKIPVLASINCIYAYDWQFFARKIQDAGADAIELNIYVLPSDLHRTGLDNEKIYYDIIKKVKEYVTIPVAVKIGYYFSSLAPTLIDISKTGIAALVLFNRAFSPDINIETFEITAASIYSTPAEYVHTLRWVGILSGRLGCDIAAATGIHTAEAAIKQLLAGANAVQVTSALYKNNIDHISSMTKGIESWMSEHKFNSIDDFRGKLSQIKLENPAVLERVQFMKLYSNIE
jgi:dihydroorotate dehydrogenase (fumarate)